MGSILTDKPYGCIQNVMGRVDSYRHYVKVFDLACMGYGNSTPTLIRLGAVGIESNQMLARLIC